LEQYINFGVDQAEHIVEGIGQLERRMDDFAHVQTEMQASIDSQTSISVTSGLTLMLPLLPLTSSSDESLVSSFDEEEEVNCRLLESLIFFLSLSIFL
jgi:hypothetical protein